MASLKSAVSQLARNEIGREWREIAAVDTGVVADHLLAPQVIVESLMEDPDAAEAEAYRQLSLVARRGDVLTFPLQLNDETKDLDLMDTICIEHDRFGLTALEGDDGDGSHPFVIIGLEPDIERRTLNVRAWGTAGSMRNLVMPNGDYLVMPSGAYLIAAV